MVLQSSSMMKMESVAVGLAVMKTEMTSVPSTMSLMVVTFTTAHSESPRE